MAELDNLVQDFLAQKKVAVVGVSDKRETGSNQAYKRFKAAGYAISAVNPHLSTFDGDVCYPDLKSIPDKPEAVFILANPKITEAIVKECVDLGIKRVWMHCLMGTKPGAGSQATSVSQAAVKMCHENGINVIPGACPNQFLNPDFGHLLMRIVFRTVGFHKISQS